MPTVSPWLGFLLIALGIGSVVLFAHAKIDNAIIPAACVTTGLAIIQAAMHAQATKKLGQTETELTTLKASMRPPSLVDEHEKKA